MTAQPQHRLFGFGSNYFHALGGSREISLSEEIHAQEYETFDDGGDGSTELKVQQLACTTTSSIILNSDGIVYQTGMIHGKYLPRPTKIRISERIVEIAGGRHFCLARSGSGAVYSWGAGHFGQLGQGPHLSFSEKPQVIKSLHPRVIGSPIVQLSCGHWHGAALTEDGRIFCWGSNRKHQCGTKTPSTIVQPQHVNGTNVIYSQVDCGKGFSIALEKSTGRVYTWGASTACGHTSRKTCISPPRLVEALQRVVVVQISAGDSHSLAVTGGGRVFSWGSGSDGQLGVGGAFPILPRPKLVGDLDFVAIVASQHSQLSNNLDSFECSTGNAPLEKNIIKDEESNTQSDNAAASAASHILASTPKVTEVYAVGSYSLAISSTGHVYAWGYNDSKVLGLSCPSTRSLPYLEPASSSSATLSQLKNRTSQARAFDSHHNILLPRRIEALHDLKVKLVAGGPSHLLVYGCNRDENNSSSIIGRTLHEVQQARRTSHAQNTGHDDLSMDSIETDAVTSATETMSPTMDELFIPTGKEAAVTQIENASVILGNEVKKSESNKLKGKKITSTGEKKLSIKDKNRIIPASESIELSLQNGIATSEHMREVKNESSPQASSAARSTSPSRPSRKPRTMSMPKIMQKLTSAGSGRRSSGKERQKRRQFFGSFGGSKT
mmetsp:Transcript_2642/g.3907  ORF Transcript_2642/g.3907 Transcript_2642/m.3907 type:complete len:666 (-) Transcript_2642:112-2109(-)|eukprot:CAMPEP_0194222954 /NCGR_PEP_ID=MMETSP0156-20130528/34055_1 /TAXON_ID=33649 /ORGANISM="Thalassionema nitzschioides, Strain L26-B" /LENGTH=665 /DNA_ID=CAMNT_0038953927 /DNA_START=90 /DNA_END=2087 /DNA_ORIENTATION=-